MTLQRIDRESFGAVISALNKQHYDKYQPVYFLILYWWRSIFGDTEFALRSFSVLLGSGSVIVIYLTALKAYGKNHALWTLIIASFSAFSIQYSQEVRPYALLMFIASLQLYFFISALVDNSSKNRLSVLKFWMVTAIGLFSSVFISIFTASLCLSDIFVYKNYRRWFKFWAPLLIVMLISVVLFVLLLPKSFNLNVGIFNHLGTSLFKNVIFVLYGLLVGTTYSISIEQLRSGDLIATITSFWLQLAILFIVLILIFVPLFFGLFTRSRFSKYKQINLLLFWVCLTSLVLSFIFAAITKINWLPRHSFYLFIFLALIIPSVFSRKYQINSRFRSISLWTRLAVISLIVLNIYSLSNYYFDPDYWKDDYRAAAQYVVANQNYNTESVFLWGSFNLLKYYGASQTLDGRELNKQNLVQEIEKLTNNSETVLIALNRDFYWKPNPKFSIETAMSDLYTLESLVKFPYFKIYRFNKRNLSKQ